MVGCAFAVDSKFFFEFGSFDEQMDIWGYENVELGFRVCIFSLIVLYLSKPNTGNIKALMHLKK